MRCSSAGEVTQAVLDASWAALRCGGRLVVHSVTADSDALLLAAHRRHGGELIRVMVETAEPIGRFVGFKPARAVTAWAAIHDERRQRREPAPWASAWSDH